VDKKELKKPEKVLTMDKAFVETYGGDSCGGLCGYDLDE